jgi:hypothetical protein
VAERVRVRDIANDEGNRLLRIVRRSAGSMVTCRYALWPLGGDELQTSLQRLVQLGPLTLEESGWVHTFGLCLRDETVRNLGTGSGLTSEARTDRSGAAGVWTCGCRRCCGTQSESQRQRGQDDKQ